MLEDALGKMIAADPGPAPRDIGSLLNRDLKRKLRAASVRVRKGGPQSKPDEAGAGEGADASDGLTGAVDDVAGPPPSSHQELADEKGLAGK